MRILLLSNKSPWPPKDGSSAAIWNIIMGLSIQNISLTVLAINTSKHLINAVEIPDEVSKSIDYKLINLETRINPFKLLINLLFSNKPYNVERFYSKEYNAELKKTLKNPFDVIQIEGLSMCHYLSTIRQHSSAAVVFRSHNVENIIWSRLATEEKNRIKSLYFRILAKRLKKLEKNIINKFDALVAISNSDLEWFKTAGLSSPALIASPGYIPEEIENYSDTSMNKVGFIGALDWLPNMYGLNWFIEQVWPIVVDKVTDAEFFVAGRNASEKTISGIKGHNITFSGEVESSLFFIKDKAVMVVPLFSGSGIRMKIIESMYHGKCIVATPVAAEGLDYEDKKNIFIESEAHAFASRIVKLLNNPGLRSEIGENAIKNVQKNYNIFAISENLVNFYRELTS
jgi:polysaccharide biosynthesis protein PslH